MTVALLSQTVLASKTNCYSKNNITTVSANRAVLDLPSIINRSARRLHQNEAAADACVMTRISDDSPFLSDAIPTANTDETYIVDGISFTKHELTQCHRVMQAATSGIETNGTVDYINYAQISIANRAIQSFSNENLSQEQAVVLARAMQNYTKDLLAMQDKLLSGNGYIASNSGEVSAYYGIQKTYSDTEIKAINDLIDEMNRISGGSKAYVGSAFTSTVASATNQSVIDNISNLFAGTDLSDSVAIEQAMAQYKAIMSPVYLASGINNEHGALTRILDSNVTKLSDLIQRLTLGFRYSTLNISI